MGGLAGAVARFAALAIAPSTRTTYSSGERRYFAFCGLYRLQALPASDLGLSSFAAFLTQSVKPGTIRSYMAAVRNLHVELGLPDPTRDATLLPRVLRGIDRTFGTATTLRRLPITMPVMRKLIAALEGSGILAPTDRLMLKAAVLLAFHGFLRCGELTVPCGQYNAGRHASRGDVQLSLSPPSLQLRLKFSKTDPFGQGVTVHVGPAEHPYCAVAAMIAYLATTRGQPHDPLFRYRNGTALTRKAFAEEVRRLLVVARVPDAELYSGHSFRIGAATTAAMAGTPEWLIRQMGRWKSDCVLRYLRTAPETMRGVAKQLLRVN